MKATIKQIISAIAFLSLTSVLAGCEEKNVHSVGESRVSSPLEDIVKSEAVSSASSKAVSDNILTAPQSELPSETQSETPSETSYTPPNNNQKGEVSDGILVLDDGRGIMLYGIGYEPGRNYAKTVNEYKEKLGTDVNVYSMVVPTQVTFYMPDEYAELSDKELPHIDDINEHLSGIIPINAYAALRDHVNEEIYYRTDHHWTQLGAYYAAKAFAETAQVKFDELSAYDKHEQSGYVGTLYGSSNEDPRIGNNPETFVWYVPKREVKTTYLDKKAQNGYEGNYFLKPDDFGSTAEWNLTYMGGDANIVHVETGLNTGRKLMILKDSYADSLAPCLFGSFDDVWIVDMRYCETSALKLAQDNGITDLLFCSCTFSATADNQYKLAEIM